MPAQSFAVLSRALLVQVSATLRAPWDINWDNIVDNVRLSWSAKVHTGPVRVSQTG